MLTFGEWIKHLRKQRPVKMSQEDLASAIGVTKGYISQIETGNSSSTGLPPRVSDEHLRAIAKIFGLSEQEIFTRATSAVPEGFSLVPSDGGAGNPATSLIRDKLSEQGIPEAALSADQMDNLITEIEAITVFRIQRMMEETEKHREKQRRHAEQESQMDERFEGEARLVSRAGRN